MAPDKKQQSVHEVFSNIRELSEKDSSPEQRTGVRKEFVRLREMFDTFQKNFEENKSTDVDEDQIKMELNKLAIDENLTLEQFMGLFDCLLRYDNLNSLNSDAYLRRIKNCSSDFFILAKRLNK